MWARAVQIALAGICLIGIVVLGSDVEIYLDPFGWRWCHIGSLHGTAKPGYAFFAAESVKILDACDDVVPHSGGQLSVCAGGFLEHGFSRSQCYVSGVIPDWGFDGKIRWQRPWHFPEDAGISNAICRSFSPILYFISNGDFAWRPNNDYQRDGTAKNIGPQFLLCGVGKMGQLAFASIPQPVRGGFQGSGGFIEGVSESADGDRSHGRECGRDCVEYPSDVSDPDNRRLVGGTFFVIGIGIILAILAFGWNPSDHPRPKQKKHERKDN
jgi:hypothetical protein